MSVEKDVFETSAVDSNLLEDQLQENAKKRQSTTSVLTSNSRLASTSLFFSGSTSFFVAGYHLTSVSPLIPVLKDLYNETNTNRFGEAMTEKMWTDVLLPTTMSIMLLGGLFGGVSITFLLKFLSRKRLLQCCHLLNIVSVLIMSLVGKLTQAHEAMIAGRFLVGLPLGVYYGLVPTILAELSSWRQQAMWQSVAAVCLALGCIGGPALAHPKVLGTDQLWPVVIAVPALFSLVYLFASIWIPNTPYYVLRKYGRNKALLVLKQLRSAATNSDLLDELNKIQSEIGTTKAVGLKEVLVTKQFRNQFIAVNALYSNYVLTGIDNINLYAHQIFVSVGLSSENASSATISLFVLQFIAGILGAKVIDRFGALKVNIASGLVIAVAYAVFITSQAILHLFPSVMPFVSIAAVGLFMLGWSGGISLSTFVLLAELTIEPTRPTAFSYGAVLFWFFAWFVGFISPYLQAYLGAYSMTVWLAFSIIFVIYQVVCLPETKGRSVEEIQKKFK